MNNIDNTNISDISIPNGYELRKISVTANMRSYQKKYYEQNLDKFKAYRAKLALDKIQCICGSSIQKMNFKNHTKTTKHIRAQEQRITGYKNDYLALIESKAD